MSSFFSSPTTHLVTAVLSPHYAACSWIEQHKQQQTLVLKAYDEMPLDSHLDTETLYNPTAIGRFFAHFVHRYKLSNSAFSCAFTSPLVTERLTTKTHATPQPHTLTLSHTQNTVWDYYYLYPTETNEYVFYVCALTQSLLLQYKLMAMKHNLPLFVTTSQTAALFNLYRHIHATTFRASQLGIDMQRCNNNPLLLFTGDTLNRIITRTTTVPPLSDHAQSLLLTMCGVAFSEGLI